MVDLHCHLIAGVDDGPLDLEQSLMMCRMAVSDGITHAVTTPHIHPGRWHNNRCSIESGLAGLKRALTEHGITLQLGFAGEVRLTDEIIRQVECEEIPYYGELDGFRIMLLEFPHGHIVPGAIKLVEWLLGKSIRPLIAHPERNKRVMNDPSVLAPFLEAGCWLQLTGSSITGGFGARAREVSRSLLYSDDVTVVASDSHNTRVRRPCLSESYDWIADTFGKRHAKRLLVDAPLGISGEQFKPHGCLDDESC